MPTRAQTSRFRVIAAIVAVVAVVGLLAILLGYIGGSGDEEVDSAEDRSSPPAEQSEEPPVEPEPDTTEPPPSSEAPATGTDPAIALERIADLEAPSAVADPPGTGSVLVSTLDGRVHAVDLASGASEVVLDLSDQVSVGGERGLLGLAIDPEGTRLYVNFTDADGDTDVRSWALADGRPQGGVEAGVVHLELGQPYANHNGGHLTFGPDGLLWIGTGDGGGSGDPGDVAQDPSRLLGKMLRVAPDSAGGLTAPATNPDWGGRPEIWGIGLRNPWRYSFDRETDQLWIADVGQNTTEEVSVVAPDAGTGNVTPNFGWDDMEGDRPFEGEPDPAFIAPVLTYGHDQGCSITGGYVYRGDDIESLYGWYLYGDFCGGYIRAVPADDPGTEPTQLVGDAGQVLSFGQLEDGELLVLTQTGIDRVLPA